MSEATAERVGQVAMLGISLMSVGVTVQAASALMKGTKMRVKELEQPRVRAPNPKRRGSNEICLYKAIVGKRKR